RDRMLAEFNTVASRRFKADFMMLGFDGGVQMLTVLSLIFFLWAGAGQVLEERMTIGAFVAFNSLVALANPQIVSLLSTWDIMQYVAVLFDRLNDVLEEDPEQGS